MEYVLNILEIENGRIYIIKQNRGDAYRQLTSFDFQSFQKF